MSAGKGNGGTVEDAARPDGDAEQTSGGLTPAEPDAPVELTRETFEALRRERDELRDQLLRRRADFENYKKRVERDRQQAAQDASASLLEALLPALDNLDRALGAAGAETTLREGVELIRRQLLGVLEAKGVTLQEPLGQPFDPEVHQALSYEAVPGQPDGTVVEVFQKGYFLGGRLLRPALVKVAKGDAESPEGTRG
jgi:molecular chaperone GrpE